MSLRSAAGHSSSGRRLFAAAIVATALLTGAPALYPAGYPSAHAHDAAASPAASPPPQMAMGWFIGSVMRLEAEARSDISMLPETPGALAREWRSFDRNGSSLGAFIGLCWVVLLAGLACLV